MTEHAQCGEYYLFRAEDQQHGIKIFNMKSDSFEKIAFNNVRDNLCYDPDSALPDDSGPFGESYFTHTTFKKLWVDVCGNEKRAREALTRVLVSLGPVLSQIF